MLPVCRPIAPRRKICNERDLAGRNVPVSAKLQQVHLVAAWLQWPRGPSTAAVAVHKVGWQQRRAGASGHQSHLHHLKAMAGIQCAPARMHESSGGKADKCRQLLAAKERHGTGRAPEAF
jgi:hypothetical protein